MAECLHNIGIVWKSFPSHNQEVGRPHTICFHGRNTRAKDPASGLRRAEPSLTAACLGPSSRRECRAWVGVPL